MAVLRMTITKTDSDPIDVVAGPKQQVAFERSRKKSMGAAFAGGGVFAEDLYWLAWKSEVDMAVREGASPVPLFDAWMDTIIDVEVSDDVDPT